MWGEQVRKLWVLASDQHGFVTARDAEELGIDRTVLVKLAGRGRLERRAWGVYRFPDFPVSRLDEYALAAIWPAGRGVLSHETALELHELCDVNPEKIHVTVPTLYRPRRGGAADLYVVHHEDLPDHKIGWVEGIRVVAPTHAIVQAVEGGLAPHLVDQAISTARRRGLLDDAELTDAGLAGR
jgi:predicted transcriptional regulator of viral defense system